MYQEKEQTESKASTALAGGEGERLSPAVIAGKGAVPTAKGSQRWLVTYADLVTVILVFFVMLQIISDVSRSKFDQVFDQNTAREAVAEENDEDDQKQLDELMMAELTELLAQADDPALLMELLKQLTQSESALKKMSDLNQLEKMAAMVAQAESPEKLLEQLKQQMSQSDQQRDRTREIKRLQQQIVKDIQRNRMQHLVEARTDPSYNTVIIEIKDSTLFASGRAELSRSGYKTIDKVVDIIQPYRDFTVNIRGHTDDRPIKTIRFPTNWELSAGRATSLLRYIVESGRIEPTRMTATGFGELMPVASNRTIVGRAQNRRVEFILQKMTQ